MNRIFIYSLVVVIVTIPAVLLARTLIDTEEDQLQRIIDGVEDERVGALIDAAGFESGGLVVSAGESTQRFAGNEREAARSMLEEVTGIDSADRVRLRQQQVTVREENATAVLNVELGDGSYVALRLNLSRQGDQWRVERIRVMG
jgi:hypothetical protein